MLHSPQRLSVTKQRVGAGLNTGVRFSVLQEKKGKAGEATCRHADAYLGKLRASRIIRSVRSGMDSSS
jgi:hypothetical protein